MAKGPIGRGPARARVARSGRTTALLAALGTFAAFALVALIAVWAVLYAPGPKAREGDTTVVALESGSGVNAIAAQLKAAGVIRSTDMFRAAAALSGSDRKLRAGEYEVPSGASLNGVINLLVSGKVVRHFVTLPEGWSSAQAVDILNAEPLLTGTIAQTPEEGGLWPETYEISRGATRESVLVRMRQSRDENLARLWPLRGPTSVVRTPEEAMILASIVEKETGVASERPRVAAVFSNRLRSGMRLESDPTIVYGVTQGRPLGRGIRASELAAATPYNTYQIDGLPPTPIANPGEQSLAAVLNPPRTNDLYFVADGTGGHVFAQTYDQHLANVARWRAIERQRAGLPPDAAPPATAGTAPGVPNAPAAAATGQAAPPGVVVPPGAKVIRLPAQPTPATGP
jgi:UPF0755 protein